MPKAETKAWVVFHVETGEVLYSKFDGPFEKLYKIERQIELVERGIERKETLLDVAGRVLELSGYCILGSGEVCMGCILSFAEELRKEAGDAD
mgnify:CR=1 FL=1